MEMLDEYESALDEPGSKTVPRIENCTWHCLQFDRFPISREQNEERKKKAFWAGYGDKKNNILFLIWYTWDFDLDLITRKTLILIL